MAHRCGKGWPGREASMSFRDILVFLDGGDASEGRLQLATKIARDHGACLSAVFLQNGQATGLRPRFAAPWLGLVTGPPTSGAIVTSQISEPADIAEQQFRDCLRSLKVEGDWHPLSRADTGELITLAQAADLVIIGQVKPDARPAPTWRPEEIVVCCGRPVLMVPYVGSYTHVGRRVLVAWDSSREAVRALNDALPLIHGADEVTLITVRARARIWSPAACRRSVSCAIWHDTALLPARSRTSTWAPPYPTSSCRDHSILPPI